MVLECCVPYCKTKGTFGFHNFPADKQRRLKWISALKVFHLDEESLSNSYRRICKCHFLPSDYVTHANGLIRLKYNTVPSQCLPNPVWLEHSYVNRRRSEAKPGQFKPSKSHTSKVPKKNCITNKNLIDFKSGIVNVSLNRKSQEEEVAALKIIKLELQQKLKSKEKVISSQHTLLKKKDRQLKLLRNKLKSTKINKVLKYIVTYLN